MKRLSLLAAFVAANAALWGVADHVQAQTQVTGGISSDATWTVANAPYVLTGDVVVQAGVTLTIEPGVEVQGTSASNNDVELIVRGAIIAAGTENNPIVFKADSGDAVGHWEGIRFENTGGATMRHVQIKNADAALEFANPTADNFVLEDISIESYRSFGVNVASSGALSFLGLSIDGTRASTSSCMNVDRVALTLTGGWIRGCGVGVLVNNAALTLSRMIISDTTTDGIRVTANRTGTYPINITQSTFYGNNDAIQVSRSSSFSYNISLSIRTSIFEDNALVVRDGSSSNYRISFSTFTNNIWSGGAQFTNTNNPSQTGTMRYKALLADPENGDFEPTDRSPARSFGPANPELGAGAVPHAGAPTGDGVHGWWYTDVTFPALSVTEVAGDMVIAPGVTVNFQPGATLEMDIEDFMDGGTDENRVEIRVLGTLEADGTISRPVRFTSGRDVPERGDWYGIVIFENTEAFNVAQVDLGYAVRACRSLTTTTSWPARPSTTAPRRAYTSTAARLRSRRSSFTTTRSAFRSRTLPTRPSPRSTSATRRLLGSTSTHAGFTYTRGVIRDNGNDGIRATISRTGTVSHQPAQPHHRPQRPGRVEFSRSSSFSYNMSVSISGWLHHAQQPDWRARRQLQQLPDLHDLHPFQHLGQPDPDQQPLRQLLHHGHLPRLQPALRGHRLPELRPHHPLPEPQARPGRW